MVMDEGKGGKIQNPPEGPLLIYAYSHDAHMIKHIT